MKNRVPVIITCLFLSFFLALPPAFAVWVWSPETGKFVNPDAAVQDTPQEQYDYAMGFYKKKDLKEATEQLRRLLRKYPGSQAAPDAQYRLGVMYEEMEDFFRAFRAYRDLTQHYPQSERMGEAIEREFRIGNLFLSGKRAKVMGLAVLPSGPRAVEVFKHIVEAAPYGEYGDQAQFHLGLAYKKTNQFEEAIQAFQTLLDQYPESRLVSQARYQIADTSYLESVAATRDQRVVDRAAEEIERFLQRYPDSSVSDKAAKLRQEIDEKNAEKNYRIGLYYEKENFLDSAFIYYRDVAQRYPATRWGQKARERLGALEKPAEYLKSEEARVRAQKEKILHEMHSVGKSDEKRRKDLDWQLKRIEKEEKQVKKSKPETLKRRRAALRQKEKELQERTRALKKKRKRYSKNTSKDLSAAFDRWQIALEKEKADLSQEKLRIQQWEKNLGVSTALPFANLMPFGKEAPTPPEQVRLLEAKRLGELAREKKDLLKEKESLYRDYELLFAEEGLAGQRDTSAQAERARLEGLAQGIEELEKTLEAQQELYKKHFGAPAWQAVWRVPKKALVKSVDVLNPFEGDSRKDWESRPREELKALESHWQEKVAAQKMLVETIAQAFDEELAQAEEKRLAAQVQEKVDDPAVLRRSTKQIEREIRNRYNEIQDRNDRKNELLEEVEKTLRAREKSGNRAVRSARALTAPAKGFVFLSRSFLFGLPERDVTLTQQAKQLSSEDGDAAEMKSLREEIELESLLIEARNQEIQSLERALQALRARGSLSETPAFRSLLVKFPYIFVREAIVSANRLVPKESRHEKLIEQLNKESRELEELNREWEEIQKALQKKQAQGSPEPLPPKSDTAEVTPTPRVPDRVLLQEEIRSLEEQLEVKSKNYKYTLERFEKTRWDKISKVREKVRNERVEEVEGTLVGLIEKEQKIEAEERELLGKKKEAVDQFLTQLPADLFTRELHLEKEEIESRLDEIQNRQSTLGEELKRLRPQESPST